MKETMTIELLIIRPARILAFVPTANVLLATPYFFWIGMGDPQIVGLIQTWFYFVASAPTTIGFGIFKSRAALIYGIFWNCIFLAKILGCSFGMNPIPMQFVHPLYCFSSNTVRHTFLSVYVISIIIYFISLDVLCRRQRRSA